LEQAGSVVVNVTPALNNIIKEADAHGVTLLNSLKPVVEKSHNLGVEIVSKNQVSKFSGWFNLIVKLKWIVPVVTLILAILAVLIAIERRKTLLRMAVGVAIVDLVLLAGLSLGRVTFLNSASHHFNRQAAAAVWDTLLRYLKTDLRWTLLIVVLVALGAWLAGPGGFAVRIRGWVASGWRWVVAQVRGVGRRDTPATAPAAGADGTATSGGWIVEHVKGLRIAGVVVAGLFVLLGGNLTAGSLLAIVIVLAVYLGLLQLLVARAGRRPAQS
jgi:hypothetical protein